MSGPRLRQTSFDLQVFPNPCPRRDYVIRHEAPEFTSVCPVTGQPDFGTVIVEYVADDLCVELKSLKYYLQSFRNQGIFYEAVTNRILDELVGAIHPRRMRVETHWTPRGGMNSVIVAEYAEAKGTARAKLRRATGEKQRRRT